MVYDPFAALQRKPQVIPDAPKPEPDKKCDIQFGLEDERKILGIDEKYIIGILIGFILASIIREL